MTTEIFSTLTFAEREERLVLKAMLAWVKLRFIRPLELQIRPDDAKVVGEIQLADSLKKVALISDQDAWVIEKNRKLFNYVAKKMMVALLPDELYQVYGGVQFIVSRRDNVVEVALLPPAYARGVNQIFPCTMYIMKKQKMIEEYKEADTTIRDNNIDIVPLLKRHLSTFLTKFEHDLIEAEYNDMKNDPEILKERAITMNEKQQETDNLNSALKAITVQGDNVEAAKLALTLHTIIQHAFKTNPHTIMKIKFGGGEAQPIIDFTTVYRIKFDSDLPMIKNILSPLVDKELKMHTHDNMIAFTTTDGFDLADPDAIVDMPVHELESVDDLDDLFENFVGPMIDLKDVYSIMDRFLQMKYQNYYN